MSYNIAVFSIELFTKTAKFIKRDAEGIEGEVHFFAHKRNIPNEDFENIEINSPGFSLIEKTRSFLSRRFNQKYYFSSQRMKNFYLKEFKEKKIDVVIAHFGPSGIDIMDICEELNLPLVVIFHGYDISKLLSQKNYILGLKSLSKYPRLKVRAVANLYHPILSEYFKKEIIDIIPNGVEVNPVNRKLKFDEKVIITQACNLVEKKGVEYSIKSLLLFLERRPDKLENVEFLICGDGPLKQQLKKIIPNKYTTIIKFLGHLSGNEFQSIKNRTDIFIHPSITDSRGETETIPTAILEFMSEKKIVLSTIHGGIPQAIIHGFNGLLHEEKDILSLSISIEKVLDNIMEYQELAENARKSIIENFEFNKQYQQFNKLIKKSINEK